MVANVVIPCVDAVRGRITPAYSPYVVPYTFVCVTQGALAAS